jgi:SAM-dependent methyltransferase
MTLKPNRMYDEFAHLWPLISSPAEYAEEAGFWRDTLRSHLGPGRHAILELGAGGGHNLSHLTSDFQATAVDLSEKMLEHCRRLNPGVPVHAGDMRSVRLGRTFEAVLIHDAIDYMLTEDDLRKALATAAAHLEPGGMLIMAPDCFRETFRPPYVRHSINSDGKTDVTLIEYAWDPDPADTVIEALFLYLIRTQDTLHMEQDRHLMGLFSLLTWLDLMRDAGFTAATRPYPVHDDERHPGLLVGILERSRER